MAVLSCGDATGPDGLADPDADEIVVAFGAAEDPYPTDDWDLVSGEVEDDMCEALLSPTLRFGLEPLRSAYRAAYGPGPARLLLQITDGRDGFAIHAFDWRLDDD